MEENERTTDVRDQLSEAAIEDLWAAIVNSFEAGKHPSDEISSDDQDESTGREGGDSKETTKETEEIDEKQEEANVVAAYSEIATRLRGALPNTVVDLQRAAKIGSAKHSLPNFIRTKEWLLSMASAWTIFALVRVAFPRPGEGPLPIVSFLLGISSSLCLSSILIEAFWTCTIYGTIQITKGVSLNPRNQPESSCSSTIALVIRTALFCCIPTV